MADWAGLGDVLGGDDPQESFEDRSLLWNMLVPPDAPEGPDQAELMRLQAQLNRVDQNTPFGSLTFSGDGEANFQLAPGLQEGLDLRTNLRNSLLENAQARAGQLPTDAFDPDIPETGQMGDLPTAMDSGQLAGDIPQAMDPGQLTGRLPGRMDPNQLAGQIPGRLDSGQLAGQIPGSLDYQGMAGNIPQAIDSGQLAGRMPTPGGQAAGSLGPMDQSTQAQQAQFERAMSLMQPQFERQGEQTRQRLANRGLPMGGEAYEGELDRMEQSQSRAMEDAAFRAVQAGNQRQGQIFQQGQADVAQRAGLQGREFQQGLAGVDRRTGMQEQAFRQGMAGIGQRAGLQGQEFQQGLSGVGQRAGLQNQYFQQGQADVSQRAGLQGQGFEQGMAGVGQRAGLQGQEFQQGMAGFQAGGDRQNQLFQQGLARLGAQQQVRQQNLNEIQAMLAGQQVGQNVEGQGQNLGSFFAPSNIDVLGAAGLEQSGDLAEWQAQQNQTQGNLSGLGSILGGMFCSREYKENNRPAESILPRLNQLKVEAWNYIGDDQTHVGPYAEDFRDLFGLGDGKQIPIVDLFGVLILGMQELTRRVEAIHGER